MNKLQHIPKNVHENMRWWVWGEQLTTILIKSGRTVIVRPLMWLISVSLVCGLQLLMCDQKSTKICSFSVLSQQWNKHRGCSWYQNVAHLICKLITEI